MADPQGFLKHTRELPGTQKPEERTKHYKEFVDKVPDNHTNKQASRCMDCGTPFCHNGCPLGNVIPEFNDAVYQEDWQYAYEILSATNNFPEFTGRICPAPCEASCVLGINQPPVAIEFIEKSIIEKAFELGYVQPIVPEKRSGKNVAVVGGGPAGLAAAVQLNKAGHNVTVYERAQRAGGLLRYGIPDFKLDKSTIDRRIAVMVASGIVFKYGVEIGKTIALKELKDNNDAVVLAGGSTVPRDLPIKGRELKGIYPAMEFLSQNNDRVHGTPVSSLKGHTGQSFEEELLATDKNVLVIGGGDTGSDCVGTSNRHGATSITQIELLSKPSNERGKDDAWPNWPMTLKTSSSHKEGVDREWAVLTKEFIGDSDGNLKAVKLVNIEWKDRKFVEIAGTERDIPCELALLAIGFVHPEHEGMIKNGNIDLTERGNVKDDNYKTSDDKIFVAGDMRRGQSLVVWAISEGREAARQVDIFLTGTTMLEGKNESFFSTTTAI